MARKKKKKKTIVSGAVALLKTGFFFLFILIAVYLIVNFVFRRTVVHNVSMMETLYDGDNIIMDELSYNISSPKRFDVICFKSYKEKDLLIKRVIGLPNETVKIIDGTIFINDREIRDVSGLEKIDNGGLAEYGITLLDNEYFVIGDNRPESIDSRFAEVGNVKRDEIIGKAAIVIWPLNHIKIIR